MTPEQKKVLEKEYDPSQYDFEVISTIQGRVLVKVMLAANHLIFFNVKLQLEKGAITLTTLDR